MSMSRVPRNLTATPQNQPTRTTAPYAPTTFTKKALGSVSHDGRHNGGGPSGSGVVVNAGVFQLLVACGVVPPQLTTGSHKRVNTKNQPPVGVAPPHKQRLPQEAVALLSCGWGFAAALHILTNSNAKASLPFKKPATTSGSNRSTRTATNAKATAAAVVEPSERRKFWEFSCNTLEKNIGVVLPTERKELILLGDVECMVDVLSSANLLWTGKRGYDPSKPSAHLTPVAQDERSDRIEDDSEVKTPPSPPPKKLKKKPLADPTDALLLSPQSSTITQEQQRQLMYMQEVQQQYLQQCLFLMQQQQMFPGHPQHTHSHGSNVEADKSIDDTNGDDMEDPRWDNSRRNTALPPLPKEGREQQTAALAKQKTSNTLQKKGNKKTTTVQKDDDVVATSSSPPLPPQHGGEPSYAFKKVKQGPGGGYSMTTSNLTKRRPQQQVPSPSMNNTLVSNPANHRQHQQPSRVLQPVSLSSLGVDTTSMTTAEQVRMRLRLRDGAGTLDQSVVAVQRHLRHLHSCALIHPRLGARRRAGMLLAYFIRFRHLVKKHKQQGLHGPMSTNPGDGSSSRPRRVGCDRCWPILLALRERTTANPMLSNAKVRSYYNACCDSCRWSIMSDKEGGVPIGRKVDYTTLNHVKMLHRFAKATHGGLMCRKKGIEIADGLREELIGKGYIPDVDL